MDYTTVYEVTGISNFSKGPIVVTLFLVIIIVWTISTFRRKETWSGKLIMCGFSLLLLYMSCNAWYKFYDVQDNAVKPYMSGNYEVAEGVVEDFKVTYEESDDIEYEYKYFTVNGESFRIPNYGESVVYCAFWKDDEIIIGNGQQARISYVCWDNVYNIIMKLEIAY